MSNKSWIRDFLEVLGLLVLAAVAVVLLMVVSYIVGYAVFSVTGNEPMGWVVTWTLGVLLAAAGATTLGRRI